MPRVPEADSPSVAMTPFQTPGATGAAADVFDIPDIAGKQATQTGAALMTAGTVLKKIADNIQYDLADAAAKDLDTKLSKADQLTVEKFQSLNSKAAVDARADTEKELVKNRESILDEYKNGGNYDAFAADMFQAASKKRLDIASHQVSSHFIHQAKIWDNASSTARVAQNLNDANRALIVDPNSFRQKDKDGKNIGAYWTFRNTAIQEVNLIADKNGVPKLGDEGDDLRKQMLLETTTKLHFDAVNNLVKQAESSPGAMKLAAAYLNEAVKAGEISADKVDDLAQLVKLGGQKQESLDLYMELSKMPLDKAIKELQNRNQKGLVSAEVFDFTQSRLEHQYNVNQAKKGEYEKAIIGQAQDWLLKNPSLGITGMPTKLYNALKQSGHLGTIQSFAKSGRFDNDPKTWGQILSMPQAELAKLTADEFYTRYRGKLDDIHLERGMEYVLGLRNPDKTKDPEMVSTRTIGEEVTLAAKQNHIIPINGPSNEKQQLAFGMFDTEVNNRLRALQQSLPGKRKPTTDEAVKVIDEVIKDKVKIDEWGRDPEMSIAVVTPDRMPKAYVTIGNRDIYISKIPQASREVYASKLRAKGMPVTQAMIAQLWAADNPEKK
jgi:hypothetical protein